MQVDYYPIRIFFKKTGRLKYLAHLDTMRTVSRAFSRSKLPIWYTQGYNPIAYVTFALPISLGYEGLRESFDIRLTEKLSPKDVASSLNRYLPEELQVIEAAEPVEDATAIAWADYVIEVVFDKKENLIEKIEEYWAQTEILVDKKSKKGMSKVDIKPHMKNFRIKELDNCAEIRIRIASGSKLNFNPRLFVTGFSVFYGAEPNHVGTTRTAILNEQEETFK